MFLHDENNCTTMLRGVSDDAHARLISMILHSHSDGSGLDMKRIAQELRDIYHVTLTSTTLQRIVVDMAGRRELTMPSSQQRCCHSPLFMTLFHNAKPSMTMCDADVEPYLATPADVAQASVLCTYVPDFAVGFLIGKSGEFVTELKRVTGVHVTLMRCGLVSLQRAVLNVAAVAPWRRETAVRDVLTLLRYRLYALRFSYRSRASWLAVAPPGSVPPSWTAWSDGPFTDLPRVVARCRSMLVTC